MSDQVKIALGGGGGAKDSRLLDEWFVSWIRPQGNLLYWPFALRGIRTLESCWDWFTTTFTNLNIRNISMWTGLSEHQTGELEMFDAVYIGGGNTFHLLAEIREHGFDYALRNFADRGKPIYGGSAGAAVLGRDIRTVDHIDHNDIELTDTSGLNMANGCAVWVHYRPQDDELIHTYVRENEQSVLALSERSGIAFQGKDFRSLGLEPAV